MRPRFALLLALAGVSLGILHAAAAEPAALVRMPKEPHIYNLREHGAKGVGRRCAVPARNLPGLGGSWFAAMLKGHIPESALRIHFLDRRHPQANS